MKHIYIFTEILKKNYVIFRGGLCPSPRATSGAQLPGPGCFWIESHLCIQTHTLRMLSTKSNISRKLKIATKKKPRTKTSVSEHCASFGMNFF